MRNILEGSVQTQECNDGLSEEHVNRAKECDCEEELDSLGFGSYWWSWMRHSQTLVSATENCPFVRLAHAKHECPSRNGEKDESELDPFPTLGNFDVSTNQWS